MVCRALLAGCLSLAVLPLSALADEPAPETKRLFTLLDVERPELSSVRAAVEAERYDRAMDLLTDHFRARFPRSQVKPRVFNRVQQDAEMAVEFRFRSRPSDKYFKLHEEFDWKNRPKEIADHHWLNLLVSLHELEFMANVYIKTGDAKFAEGAMRVFDDWLEHCPPGSGAPSWSLATTMIRSGVLLRVYERMVQWSDWPDDAHARMLCAIHDHLDFMVQRRGPGNQDSTNSEHLMRLGVAFPEFKDAGRWLAAGYERIRPRIFEDVLEDGAQRELTSGYHLNAINSYATAAERLKTLGKPLDSAYNDRLEKMFEWAMVMIRPDGSVPVNGDSIGSQVYGYLQRGADMFDRCDMLYLATRGKQGAAPNFLDGQLPVAGYYTLRTGWDDPQAMYVFLDASRQPVVSHQDYDALHIDLFAYGRDFLPDKGTYTYGGEYHKAAKATRNHTTITIDDSNQADAPATCHAFTSTPQFGFVDASQSGYKQITHRRQVVLVRPAKGVAPYVVLIDRVVGAGAHKVDQLFHFAPGGAVLDADGTCAVTTYDSGPNLRVESLLAEGVRSQIIETEMHPRQGATAVRPGVRFTREGPLPAMFVTLLLPYPGERPPDVDARVMGEADIDGAIRVRVAQARIVDELSIGVDASNESVTLKRQAGGTPKSKQVGR